MDLWYPGANRRPLYYVDSLPYRDTSRPTIIGHTNAGGSDLFTWFQRPGNSVASHFQVYWDGTCDQFIPWDKEAYAEFAGNRFALAVEFQDDGNVNTPLTIQQLNTWDKLVRWSGAPIVLSPVVGPGIGWHDLYLEWNQSGHYCPGPIRQAQFEQSIVRLKGSKVTDMAYTIVTRPDGSDPRIVADGLNSAGRPDPLHCYAVMGAADLAGFKAAPDGIVRWWPRTDYDAFTAQHS